MSIQVLGSGCTTCHRLFELTEKAVKEMGIDIKVEYIPDITKVIEMGVMQSPVLAMDGKPVMTGFTPDINVLKEVIRKNLPG